MLNIKLIVFLFLSLAGVAAGFAAWSHRQHSLATAMKAGGARLVLPDQAKQIQQFRDR